MHARDERFADVFETWATSNITSQRTELEQYLRANLREAWTAGDAEDRQSVVHFIQLTRQGDFDIVLSALGDDDTGVARFALGAVAALVWQGHSFEPRQMREKLESFATRHPDARHVSDSILRRLHG